MDRRIICSILITLLESFKYCTLLFKVAFLRLLELQVNGTMKSYLKKKAGHSKQY